MYYLQKIYQEANLDDYYKRSGDLHRKNHGKIEVQSKVPTKTQDDLSNDETIYIYL